MKHDKPVGSRSARDGHEAILSPWTFIRAAGLANALLAPVVVAEFCILAVIYRDARALLVGLALVCFMTLAIWTTAAILGGATLISRWLWVAGRRLLRRIRPVHRGRSGVWDEWLDR